MPNQIQDPSKTSAPVETLKRRVRPIGGDMGFPDETEQQLGSINEGPVINLENNPYLKYTPESAPYSPEAPVKPVDQEGLKIGLFTELKFTPETVAAEHKVRQLESTIKEQPASINEADVSQALNGGSQEKTEPSQPRMPKATESGINLPRFLKTDVEKIAQVLTRLGESFWKLGVLSLVKEQFFGPKPKKESGENLTQQQAQELKEKEEQEAREAVARRIESHIREANEQNTRQAEQEELAKEATSIGVADLTEDEKREGLNKYSFMRIFRKRVELKKKRNQQEKGQSIAETAAKPVAKMGMFEGGTGGAQTNITTTGGGGVG